jgi:uncharacterized OB-fold protein
MKCEVCGYTSSTDFEFCQNCGAKATKEALPDSPTPKIFAYKQPFKLYNKA